MKLPDLNRVNVSGISTMGLLGITLIVLIAIDKISAWWMILAVICVLSAIGTENKHKH